MSNDTKFSVLCTLFTWIQKTKLSPKKRAKFRKYLDHFCKPENYFASIRLILPNLDRERGTYGLKESVLAICLIDALGMSRESEDAIRLINWRKGGPKTGSNVGNFALVAAEVLQRRQGMASGGLTINELNDLLDTLASSENRAEKTSVLATLIAKTNAQEMKWIIMIILKDLKLGISEKSIFHEFHPDAEDLFNVTCDLKLVCEKLRDRSQRHKRQDIEIGRPVRPQLATRVGNAAAAWKKLHGKEVVVECKFDGDRIQIHKNGAEIHFFSRNFLDHPEYEHAMSEIIQQNILVDRCILDGEMLVWDTSLNRFAEFGSNQEIAKAAKEGLDSDRQLCYVAFDVLYVGDSSVIHQSLKERHELLHKVVKPLKGRLEILVPDAAGLNANRTSGEPCWSFIAHNVDEVERFFKETIENRDEGIILKDLGSKWEPSDRSGKWLKLKPDYVNAGSDLDVLIIGGYYGSGRHGGEVAQFLVGLAERPSPNIYPRRFVSFCRVGTGLSDDELDALITKLKPYFRKNEYPKKSPPSFYQVTNNSKERPDVWIDSPEKSIILSITSDIRTVRSEVFAAPYSLRFPRIDRVRYDKPWHECLNVQQFIELVHSSNGATQNGKDYGGPQSYQPKRRKSSKKGEKSDVSVVPHHLVQTDVSSIKGESKIFSEMMFYFVNVPSTHSFDSLHKLVVENGGTFSMNLNNSVTHCVAAESKGIKYQAAKLRGDVIHYSWVLDCCAQKKLLQFQPKYFVFLSESSKKKLQEDIDEYSDSYYMDLDIPDMKQLLSNIDRSEDSQVLDYYKQKYCPKERWHRFHNCHIYFHLLMESLNSDWEVVLKLAIRRMILEVVMAGGTVSNNLSHATHLVVLSVPGFDLDFDTILRSFSMSEKHCLRNKRLHVVGFQWLEDCLEDKKLPEDVYTLKPDGFEESNIEDSKSELGSDDSSGLDSTKNLDKSFCTVIEGKQGRGKLLSERSRIQDLPKIDNKRKRDGRDSMGLKGRRKAASQAQRTWTRLGKRPAKISEIESDENSPENKEESVERESLEVQGSEMIEDSGSSKKTSVSQALHMQPRLGQRSTKISEIESNENRSPDEKINEEETGERNYQCHKMVERRSPGLHENEMVEDSVLSRKGKVAKKEDAEECRKEEFLDEVSRIELDGINEGKKSEKHEKLEVMVDPVKALLFDMIPSLGKQKVETTNPPVTVNTPESDAPGESIRKKKVSYKDMAGELLKDW